MFWTKVIIVLCAIFTYCESASLVANIKKCPISEDECQQALYRSIFQEIADSGIPDMGIPAIDPYEIKNMEMVAMSLLKIGMPEGVLKGFKSCKSNRYHTDAATLTTSVGLVCESLSIEGQYNVATTPTLEALIGGIKVHGEGKSSVVVENVEINVEVPWEVKKMEDCELHAVFDADKITYTYKILGKATLALDNLFIGSQDISTVVVNVFNENWEFLSNTFSKSIFDKGIEVFTEFSNKFFAAVPLKDLTTDDLTEHVTH